MPFLYSLLLTALFPAPPTIILIVLSAIAKDIKGLKEMVEQLKKEDKE
jgi:hypothetical protein